MSNTDHSIDAPPGSDGACSTAEDHPDIGEFLRDTAHVPPASFPPFSSHTGGASAEHGSHVRKRQSAPCQLPKTDFPYQALIETYLTVCRPYQLPPPWDCIKVDSSAYLGPADPQAAVSALTA